MHQAFGASSKYFYTDCFLQKRHTMCKKKVKYVQRCVFIYQPSSFTIHIVLNKREKHHGTEEMLTTAIWTKTLTTLSAVSGGCKAATYGTVTSSLRLSIIAKINKGDAWKSFPCFSGNKSDMHLFSVVAQARIQFEPLSIQHLIGKHTAGITK